MKRLVKLFSIFVILVFLLVSCNCEKPQEKVQPKEVKFEFGVASYSLRKFSAEKALAFTKKLGIENIAFKSFHLKLDAADGEIAEVVQMCKDAGVNLYAGGVIYMNTEAEVVQAFEYAQKAGMKVIVGVPKHELLPYVEQKVKDYNIKLAIHNHGPGDKLYPSAEIAYNLIKDMNARMGLCLDIGHTTRIGRDPSEDLVSFFGRVHDIHIKDVTAASHEGNTCEIGRGIIDIEKFLKTLLDMEYDGMVSFEYEKDGDNPFAGMAESVGYVRGMLKILKQN